METAESADTPAARLMHATHQSTLADALAWIADGYALIGDQQQVLRDLAAMDAGPDRERAAQTLTDEDDEVTVGLGRAS